MSFRGQACWAKMTSSGGKLTALACHPTKKVNIVEELTHLSTNIAIIPYRSSSTVVAHLAYHIKVWFKSSCYHRERKRVKKLVKKLFSGLYYKHIMIVIDAASVISK
jgi:hypothetical protein